MEFKLNDKFVNKYKNIKPAFGFNGLGELAYLRTYSRIKEDRNILHKQDSVGMRREVFDQLRKCMIECSV